MGVATPLPQLGLHGRLVWKVLPHLGGGHVLAHS